jgi:hypothetical protein
MQRPQRPEAAVSEVIGTILLLGITVAAFSGLAVAVQARLDTNPPPPNARFELQKEGPNLTVVHRWGESVPLKALRVIYNNGTNHTKETVPALSTFNAAKGGEPDMWDLGERLIIACPDKKLYVCMGKGHNQDESIILVDDTSQTVLFEINEGAD